ncbi:uncharacterized protein [Diadema setosum]|uniref:uncharacterized protein n=1 Tax=Diadema setosum TaxID=31175 RepID=UPI003B3B7371
MVKRRPNLTLQQVSFLSSFVKRKKGDLFGKAGHCADKVKKRKDATWQNALDELEAQGLPRGRTAKDLRLTWTEMSSKARKYRDLKFRTGGGPPVERVEKWELVLDALVEESVEGFADEEEESGVPISLLSQASQASENTIACGLLHGMGPQETYVEEDKEVEEPEEEEENRAGTSADVEPVEVIMEKKKTGVKRKTTMDQGPRRIEKDRESSSYEERLLALEERKLEVLEKLLAVACHYVYGEE